MRVTSLLLRQKKVTKEKATPSLRPLRVAKGRPASGRLRGAPQNSLRAGALRSNNCGELDNDAGALRRACSPRNRPAAGAASRGGEPNSQTATRAIAALGLAVAARSACAFWAERSAAKQWPVWLLAPQAPLYAPRSAAGGVACGPQDTHASWSDSSQLFERSASARSEFCDAPRPRAPQVARSEAKGRRQRGRLFFGDFLFGDAKESYSHAGRLPASALNPSMPLKPASQGFDRLSQNGPEGQPRNYKNNSYQRLMDKR